jgi:hypothetical protein
MNSSRRGVETNRSLNRAIYRRARKFIPALGWDWIFLGSSDASILCKSHQHQSSANRQSSSAKKIIAFEVRMQRREGRKTQYKSNTHHVINNISKHQVAGE